MDALTASFRAPERFMVPGSASVSLEREVLVPLSAQPPAAAVEGRVDGCLAAKPNPARPLTAEDRQLLAGVASHIAVAIAKERLTESERSRLRSYAIAVTRAQEEERKRIARELHDEASQNLVVIIRRRLADLTARRTGDWVAAELGELRDLAG